MTTTSKTKVQPKLIDQVITLPLAYQLPHPTDLSDSPLEQEILLQKKAVRILRELSQLAKAKRERLDDATQDATEDFRLQQKVESLFAAGQLPPLPGVITEKVLSAVVVAEKTAEYAEKGLQLIKIAVTPAFAGAVETKLVYIDPKVTSLESVKAQMLESIRKVEQSSVERAKADYDSHKAIIEKFHKHFVQRTSQLSTLSDIFKNAKAI